MDKTVNVWLNIAIEDLESAIILHQNQFYRNSYFLFQQAREKANKASALFSGDFNEEDIRKASHNQFEIPRKFLVQRERKMKMASNLIKSFPLPKNLEPFSNESFTKQHQAITNSIRTIDQMKNYDLVNFTLNDLDGYLNLLQGCSI